MDVRPFTIAVEDSVLEDLRKRLTNTRWPDEMPNTRMSSRGRIFVDLARSRGLTIRELYLSIAGGNGHYRLVGTPRDIVDEMQAWIEGCAADGFNILPTHLPGGLEDVVVAVRPLSDQHPPEGEDGIVVVLLGAF